MFMFLFFFFSSRRRHTRYIGDWSSDVCSSDLTAGVVYNVFDLLGGEELITAHIEGGPQSLQTLLGVAKEGLLGTRVSLGLSLFNNLVRPNLPGSPGHRRLFTSRSSGFGLSSTYPLAASDTLGVNR